MALAGTPIGEDADRQRAELGFLGEKDEGVHESINAEEIDVRLVVRPHRQHVPSQSTRREVVRSISHAAHRDRLDCIGRPA